MDCCSIFVCYKYEKDDLSFLVFVQDEDEDEDDEDDDEEDDNNVMFDGVCRLFSRDGQSDSNETSLGVVGLRIIYDDDVYGARIIAVDQEVRCR